MGVQGLWLCRGTIRRGHCCGHGSRSDGSVARPKTGPWARCPRRWTILARLTARKGLLSTGTQQLSKGFCVASGRSDQLPQKRPEGTVLAGKPRGSRCLFARPMLRGPQGSFCVSLRPFALVSGPSAERSSFRRAPNANLFCKVPLGLALVLLLGTAGTARAGARAWPGRGAGRSAPGAALVLSALPCREVDRGDRGLLQGQFDPAGRSVSAPVGTGERP